VGNTGKFDVIAVISFLLIYVLNHHGNDIDSLPMLEEVANTSTNNSGIKEKPGSW
jgi:hypothetical protein